MTIFCESYLQNQISSTSLISSENQDKNIDSDEEEESEEDEKEFTDSDERKDDEEGTNSREESRNVLEDGLCEKFEESVSVPDDPERKENSDSNSNTSCLDSRDTDSSQSCQKTDGGQRHHTQDKLPVTEVKYGKKLLAIEFEYQKYNISCSDVWGEKIF